MFGYKRRQLDARDNDRNNPYNIVAPGYLTIMPSGKIIVYRMGLSASLSRGIDYINYERIGRQLGVLVVYITDPG